MSEWLHGSGEMAARIRDFDWAATPLGPIATWSERFKVMVEQILASPLVATLVCGPERILVYNDRAARLFGDHHPAALGRPLPETFPEGWPTVVAFYERAFAGETVQVAGQPLDTRGEGTVTDVFDALLTPVRENDGRIPYVHMTGTEVADRARAEAKLRESEARHRLLIESWTQAVWETDATGVVVTDSPSWRAYTGQSLEEWLGYGWLGAIHPDDRAYAEREWREAIAAQGLVNAEYRLRAPGGDWRWTNVRAAPVFGAEGRIEKWVGVNIDIDARKRAEAAIRESEEKYRSVFENIDEGFCIWDVVQDADRRIVDLCFVEVNPAFERQTGLSHVVGQRVSEVAPGTEAEWIETYGEVARTGTDKRFEMHHADTGRWYDIYASQLRGPHSPRVSIVFRDITERRRAEVAERDSKEHQAFLLRLSDALRAEPDADAVANRALEMLFDHLRLDRCYITYYSPADDEAHVRYQLGNDTVPPLPTKVRLSDFPDAYEQVLDRTFVIEDDFERRGHSETERANSKALGMRAMVASTMRRGERRPLASMAAVSSRPRRWSPAEITLVEEAAERTWAAIERARAEAELRESEERFRQFADASAAGLWIRDASTLAMEFVSPVIGTIYGVEPDALLGDVQGWAAMIVPEDREVALSHLDVARSGEVAVHEFRIQRPSDGTFRWIKNIDFPLHDNGRIPRIGGIAEDVTDAKLAAEHSAVLLGELQHRVRNIMALLRSITNRTGERAESVPEYRDLMMGRLLAFARVQALLTRTANVSVGIASIVHDEVSVQAQHEDQYMIEGQDVALSPKAAEVLTLAIHELATNAVKYGALSVPDGRVTVRWSTFEKRGGRWLAFDWIEEGAPAQPQPSPDTPRRRGFGSELIEARIPYELRGRGQVSIEPGGARCHLEFPLQEGASILETGAPQRATVFGGAIDMTGEPDLTGRSVLVVEDDYYLATDTARALRGAGAEVLGPCATEEDARAELAEQRPDAVVVDINLGRGPSFKLAETLKDQGIPFVFTTGYDAEVIPAEFEGVERLQKPLHLRQIVGSVAKLAQVA